MTPWLNAHQLMCRTCSHSFICSRLKTCQCQAATGFSEKANTGDLSQSISSYKVQLNIKGVEGAFDKL